MRNRRGKVGWPGAGPRTIRPPHDSPPLLPAEAQAARMPRKPASGQERLAARITSRSRLESWGPLAAAGNGRQLRSSLVLAIARSRRPDLPWYAWPKARNKRMLINPTFDTSLIPDMCQEFRNFIADEIRALESGELRFTSTRPGEPERDISQDKLNERLRRLEELDKLIAAMKPAESQKQVKA